MVGYALVQLLALQRICIIMISRLTNIVTKGIEEEIQAPSLISGAELIELAATGRRLKQCLSSIAFTIF